MKRTVGVLLILLILLFTGCSEDALPKENIIIIEQLLDLGIKGKEVDENSMEKEDEKEKQSIDQQKEKHRQFNNVETVMLSDKELVRIQLVMEEYYSSINKKIIDYVQVDSSSSFMQEYEGYAPDEVVLFEVLVDNSENKRYITIGSKDGWNNCSVLNEGY